MPDLVSDSDSDSAKKNGRRAVSSDEDNDDLPELVESGDDSGLENSYRHSGKKKQAPSQNGKAKAPPKKDPNATFMAKASLKSLCAQMYMHTHVRLCARAKIDTQMPAVHLHT